MFQPPRPPTTTPTATAAPNSGFNKTDAIVLHLIRLLSEVSPYCDERGAAASSIASRVCGIVQRATQHDATGKVREWLEANADWTGTQFGAENSCIELANTLRAYLEVGQGSTADAASHGAASEQRAVCTVYDACIAPLHSLLSQLGQLGCSKNSELSEHAAVCAVITAAAGKDTDKGVQQFLAAFTSWNGASFEDATDNSTINATLAKFLNTGCASFYAHERATAVHHRPAAFKKARKTNNLSTIFSNSTSNMSAMTMDSALVINSLVEADTELAHPAVSKEASVPHAYFVSVGHAISGRTDCLVRVWSKTLSVVGKLDTMPDESHFLAIQGLRILYNTCKKASKKHKG